MGTIYTAIFKNIIIPIADKVCRNEITKYYTLCNKSQWWDTQKLTEYQNKRIADVVKIAYAEVPFYKALYDINAINTKLITNRASLPLLPVVTKQMLRSAYPDKCTRKTVYPWREYFTSGSSGKPFTVRIDSYSMCQARALMLLRANYSGWNIGEPFLQTGMTLNRGILKKIKDVLLRVYYVSAYDLSDVVLDKYLEIIDKNKIEYVTGYAGSLYCLAVRAEQLGFNMSLKGIVTWGDNLYLHYREKMESVFRCKVTDTYGCGEGIQIAAQCGMNDGVYHIFMPHVFVEVVDDQGEQVKPGDSGNILLTRLDPGVMPLIRYKVGDIGRKSTEHLCACGRGLEMLAKIEGRDSDIIITPNGNRLIVHFFTGIFEYYQSVESFKIIQEKPAEITVEIIPRSDFDENQWQKIKNEILQKGDPDLNIELKLVDNIPLEKSNKRRFVVSKIL